MIDFGRQDPELVGLLADHIADEIPYGMEQDAQKWSSAEVEAYQAFTGVSFTAAREAAYRVRTLVLARNILEWLDTRD